MALGSEPASILRLVLREGAVLVAIGLAVGIAGARALRQIIASQLYGVGALDPVVLGTVAAVLSTAAFVACLAPARRASRVNPVVALAQR
jgi:ABC-type antimicrobial peptide transport system permease subunit